MASGGRTEPRRGTCPTCGVEVEVVQADEGTAHFRPVNPGASDTDRLLEELTQRFRILESLIDGMLYDDPTVNFRPWAEGETLKDRIVRAQINVGDLAEKLAALREAGVPASSEPKDWDARRDMEGTGQ